MEDGGAGQFHEKRHEWKFNRRGEEAVSSAALWDPGLRLDPGLRQGRCHLIVTGACTKQARHGGF